MNTETKRLLPNDIPHRLQRKGRALSAARLGLRDAIAELEEARHWSAAENARSALKRSYRMENEDGSEQTAA